MPVAFEYVVIDRLSTDGEMPFARRYGEGTGGHGSFLPNRVASGAPDHGPHRRRLVPANSRCRPCGRTPASAATSTQAADSGFSPVPHNLTRKVSASAVAGCFAPPFGWAAKLCGSGARGDRSRDVVPIATAAPPPAGWFVKVILDLANPVPCLSQMSRYQRLRSSAISLAAELLFHATRYSCASMQLSWPESWGADSG
jgi:hypothetical protein